MDNLTLINVRSPGYQGLQQITVEQGIITTIAPMTDCDRSDSSMPILDLAGDWISLGGIDLQINGALGLPFPELHPDNCNQLSTIGEYLWQQGIDAYLPTLVTTSIDNIQRSLSLLQTPESQIANPKSKIPNRQSQILGVHLEGPFLNPQKRGAHPQAHLLPLTLDHIQRVLGDYASRVKIMTLAPELDETGKVIPYLQSLGITVSLGHSQATATQAQRAFDQGASMVTHAFNAMPPLHHREPGLLGAAIVHPQVHCGFIADGQHVSPIMIDLFLRASHYQKGAFLVSDALSPLGLPDGIYPWDTRQIEVKHGTARLPDGTLSGTTLPLLTGVQNLVNWGICDIESAIALATTAPRQAIGIPTELLQQPANLLRWHWDGRALSWTRLG